VRGIPRTPFGLAKRQIADHRREFYHAPRDHPWNRGGSDSLAAVSGTVANYSGIISGSGGTLLIGDGVNNGTIVLSGNNTYGGGTHIFSGILVAAGNNALGTAGRLKTVWASG
jgi:autotransporter-associated beta strand protein